MCWSCKVDMKVDANDDNVNDDDTLNVSLSKRQR